MSIPLTFSECLILLIYCCCSGQPEVNHRNVSLSTLQKRLIPSATKTKGEALGFEEQTYGIIYQVENSNSPLAVRGVPIYCAYTTESSLVTPPLVEGSVAIFPTRQGILDLLRFLNLSDVISEHYHTPNFDEDEPFLPLDLVRKLFESPAFLEAADANSGFKEPVQAAKFSITQYKEKKQKFQSAVKIRIGMIGGLHRTGTSCFFFSGEEARPNKEIRVPRNLPADGGPYHFLTPDMVINVTTPLTILSPKDSILTKEYIKQCNAYSYHIEERKDTSVKVTYCSLSSKILDSSRHQELPDVSRYKSDAIFTTPAGQVRIGYFCISFINRQQI